jgi:hypothetical protein
MLESLPEDVHFQIANGSLDASAQLARATTALDFFATMHISSSELVPDTSIKEPAPTLPHCPKTANPAKQATAKR